MSTLSRLCSVARVGEKNGSDDYPEMVEMITLILGKAFSGLEVVAFDAFGAGDGTTLSCFSAFSIGAGEDVRGRFEDCPIGAVQDRGARRVVSVLGSPLSTRRRIDLFVITRVVALLVLLCIRVPLATLAPARLSLDILLLHSIGH